MRAKAPPVAKGNWASISKVLLPIAQLPAGSTPVVLWDETKTISWFSDKPSKAAIKHTRAKTDEAGAAIVEEDAHGQQQVVEEHVEVAPAFFSYAAYVDKHGEPV